MLKLPTYSGATSAEALATARPTKSRRWKLEAAILIKNYFLLSQKILSH